ncbi:unnamed protein product [Arctia plantaginis]|uniref:Uncharacterized protein n=1 Tax=Arctia plantaginis TaxID=874455 RepID=A0A8S1AP88_ARCPL|nr:unnamed protein product [Arctia plantaginis]
MIAVHMTNALAAMKVLHIPEKIIGGVIDIVQNHKNKPTQQATFQGQNQQQSQQGYGWNSGFQTQGQNQAQYQYGNYGYPQTGPYPQGNYVNSGQVTGPGYQSIGGSQAQTQSQYQNYPQNQSGGQYQGQNQQSSGQQSNQFQNQMQNGYQGQQTQIQVQNQINNQFPNQNPQTSMNFQGTQHVNNQLVAQNKPNASYGTNQQTPTFTNSQQSGNYIPQGQASSHYIVPNQPQGQISQTTSFDGQNHQLTQFQTGAGSYGGSQGFLTSTGHHSGTPGPTCVCQAFTKPQNDMLKDVPSQRNDNKTEKPVANE